MTDRNTLLIVLVILIVVLAVGGIVAGVTFYRVRMTNNSNNIETFNLTLDDMYSNIKDSKKIVKSKITIVVSNKNTYQNLEEKQYLIRDNINKIIRNKTEDDLQGKEGQKNLQAEIETNLVDLFNDNSIINVYFDDFIIQ